ncbi:MAG: transposase [Cytophagales bacterium]
MTINLFSVLLSMSTHRIHPDKDCFYFLTFTCHKWLPLLKLTELENYFFIWLSRLNDKGILISAYVMMPNHIHLLVFVSSFCTDFNLVIGEAKRFMAYEIVKRLKSKKEKIILHKLRQAVQVNESAKGKRHQVFRLSFDAKMVIGMNSLNRVAEYIHYNPVSGKWKLVNDFTQYSASSAAYYHLGKNNRLIKADFRGYSPLDLRVSLDKKSKNDSERGVSLDKKSKDDSERGVSLDKKSQDDSEIEKKI